jgi:hypothetical protein
MASPPTPHRVIDALIFKVRPEQDLLPTVTVDFRREPSFREAEASTQNLERRTQRSESKAESHGELERPSLLPYEMWTGLRPADAPLVLSIKRGLLRGFETHVLVGVPVERGGVPAFDLGADEVDGLVVVKGDDGAS